MDMGEGILVAIITLCGSGIGSLRGIIISNKLTNYRIGKLEKKVDKHNLVIDRTYKVEERIALIEKDVEVTNHRIENLEER